MDLWLVLIQNKDERRIYMNSKNTVRIMLDFLAGPIWTYYYNPTTKEYRTGNQLVDNDAQLKKINDEIQDLYSSYYYFGYKDQPCYFDEEQERADKEKMLALLEKLRDEINDGSFVVEDEETERVKNL